jgi:prephenate dehydrogenase
MPKSLAIIGLGLMGGSLGLAAKARGVVDRVTAHARREESRRDALELGAVDAVFDSAEDAVEGADLVVVCTPVLTMPDLVRHFCGRLSAGCVVTDVGSTKAFLARELGQILADSPARFVGSHPMAGSEKTGLDVARVDLYEGARVIVTPADGDDDAATRCISEFWEGIGAAVSVLSPDAHDAVIARTSHLPHLVAAALVSAIDRGDQDLVPFCGPGFRDTTRVAEGSEAVWHDIVKTNLGSIRQEVDRFSQEIAVLKTLLDHEDMDGVRAFLANSREKRVKFGV